MTNTTFPKTYDINFLDIILTDVAWFTKVSKEKLKSKDRHDNVVIAKKIFVTLAKEFVKTDLGTIGATIEKTHATVIFALKTFSDIYDTNVKVRKIYDELIENLDKKRSFQRQGLFRCIKCAGPNVKSMAMVDLNTEKTEYLETKYCTDCKCETEIRKIDIVGWSSWSAREHKKIKFMKKYYAIYKVTNLINNKIYIGKHQTENLDDNYLGSGKAIKASIKKYGKKKFKKEILFIFDNEQDMTDKESKLVTEEFINSIII